MAIPRLVVPDPKLVDPRLVNPQQLNPDASRVTALQLRLGALERQTKLTIANGYLSDISSVRAALANESKGVRQMILALDAPQISVQMSAVAAQAFNLSQVEAYTILLNNGAIGADSVLLGQALAALDTSLSAAADIPGDVTSYAVTSSAALISAQTFVAGTDTVNGLSQRVLDGLDGLQAALDAAVTDFDEHAIDNADKRDRLSAASADPEMLASPMFATAASLSRMITSVIAEGSTQGAMLAAAASGVPLVWVAEADACVDCLAYSGQVVDAGNDFPGGLTFADQARFTDPLQGPPLHPNCRCTVEPLGAPEYADALQREAERSVLRGFSLESESMRTRIGAARLLLSRHPDAPKSVIAYAEKSVKNGGFSTRNKPAGMFEGASAARAAAEAPAPRMGGAEFATNFEKYVPAGREAFVNHYTPAEVDGMKAVLTSNDGATGLLVKDHGDGRIEMTGLYNGSGIKGAIGPLISESIDKYGVNYAECFGPALAVIYERYNFRIVESYPFDPAEAPVTWNYARDDSPPYNIMELKK